MRSQEPDHRTNRRRLLRSRKFVSLLVTVGFLILLGSGIVFILAPTGRVAHRTGWEIFGLSKEQWVAIHLTSSVLFLGGAVFHGLLNWRPLVRYLRPKLASGLPVSTELVAAVAVGVLFVAATLAEMPPLSSLVDLRGDLKHRGETSYSYGDREAASGPGIGRGLGRTTLDELCRREGLALGRVVSDLDAAGIDAEGSTLIRQVADECGITPRDLLEQIRGH